MILTTVFSSTLLLLLLVVVVVVMGVVGVVMVMVAVVVLELMVMVVGMVLVVFEEGARIICPIHRSEKRLRKTEGSTEVQKTFPGCPPRCMKKRPYL